MAAIKRTEYIRGRTNTSGALRMVREQIFVEANGDRPTIPNFAIIVTDGYSNIESDKTIPEAIENRVAGIHQIVATVENDPNNLEIKGLASDPDTANIFNVVRYSQLPSMIADVVQATCNGTFRLIVAQYS